VGAAGADGDGAATFSVSDMTLSALKGNGL